MLGKVLVPLDGSALAEAALPYAEDIARSFQGEITLVNVVPMPPAGVSAAHEAFLGQQGAEAESSARRYLDEKATQLRSRGLEVREAVLSGPVADTLLQYAAHQGIELIALATHGRAGLERWMVGSVTDHLIHGSSIPVLTLRPPRDGKTVVSLARVLVGLDGSDLAEAALPYAAELARRLKLTVTLVQVVPSEVELFAGSNYVAYPIDIVSELKAAAGEYLDEKAAQVSGAGLICDTVVGVGGPVSHLIEAANHVPGTLIVVSSHGRSGLGRTILGSVADRVIHESHGPVLVVRARSSAG
ncbi:MAG: universal stress protein [Dehalococcoidia bacterium]|nr:universal stress protein [Dehalococcoidia bacterium]